MTSLVKDLSDGVRLIQLMVCSLGYSFDQGIDYVAKLRRLWVTALSPFVDVTGPHICVFVHPGDTSLGRYNKQPRMRVQKAENVNKALEFITSRGVKLTNIGPEGL